MAKEVKTTEKIPTLKGSCLWGVLLFFLLLLVDLVTKVAAEEYFTRPDAPAKIDVIKGWISLRITYNRGIAYGVGHDAKTWVKLLVIAATAALMLVLAVVYFRLDKRRSWARIALVLVVAGGVGNLIDRVFYQVWDPATAVADPLVADGVRDMVDLSRFGFAVCNFADFFICIGAALLVLSMLFFDKDAIFPVGKYKDMAKQMELAEVEEKSTEMSVLHG